MIKYVKRTAVDIEKYNMCIEKSMQRRVYAFSWYLDIVAADWNVLVLDDYAAVMPIPYVRAKRNLYRKKIIQPLFCQQLGVFSLDELPAETYSVFIHQFLKLAPNVYQFNTDNSPFLKGFDFLKKERVNYELSLQKPYEVLKKGYSKNLKRNISKAQKAQLTVKNTTINELLLMKKNTASVALKNKNYQVLKKLLEEIDKQKKGNCIGVYNEDELIASAFFIHTKNRIIHLISSSTIKGKKRGATALLFDYLIKKHEKVALILDFEGSVIEGVARFFRSFGAKPVIYYQVNED